MNFFWIGIAFLSTGVAWSQEQLLRSRSAPSRMGREIPCEVNPPSSLKALNQFAMQLRIHSQPVETDLDEIEMPLEKLIGFSQNENPSNTIESFGDLNQKLKDVEIAPLQMERIQHLVKMMADYQFEDAQVVRELIANGLDSHYYSEKDSPGRTQAHPRVEVILGEGEMRIRDQGAGMNLSDIVYYLLTPGRSKNGTVLRPDTALDGVSGRFGQGFFSVLSFLKNPGDSIVIDTKTSREKPFRVILEKNQDQNISVRIQALNHTERKGTEILIRSKGLVGLKKLETEKAIHQDFRFNRRGSLELNGQRVNPDGLREEVQIFDSNGNQGTVAIPAGAKPIKQGKGSVYVQINGILIKEVKVQGVNIYPQVILDLPLNMPLTSDRSTLDLKDPKWIEFFRAALSDLSGRPDGGALINSLFAVLGEDAEAILPQVEFQISSRTAPAVPVFAHLKAIGGKKVQLVHPEILKLGLGFNPIRSELGPEQPSIVVTGEFDAEEKNQFAVYQKSGKPLIVVSDKEVGSRKIDLHSPILPHVFQIIQTAESAVTGKREQPWLNHGSPSFSGPGEGQQKQNSDQKTKITDTRFGLPEFSLDLWAKSPIFSTSCEANVLHPIEDELKYLFGLATEVCREVNQDRVSHFVPYGFCLDYVNLIVSVEAPRTFPCGTMDYRTGQRTLPPGGFLDQNRKKRISDSVLNHREGSAKLSEIFHLMQKWDHSDNEYPSLYRDTLRFLKNALQKGYSTPVKQISDFLEYVQLAGGNSNPPVIYENSESQVTLERLNQAIKNKLANKAKSLPELYRSFEVYSIVEGSVALLDLCDRLNQPNCPSREDWSFIDNLREDNPKIDREFEAFLEFALSVPSQIRLKHVHIFRQLMNFFQAVRFESDLDEQGKEAFKKSLHDLMFHVVKGLENHTLEPWLLDSIEEMTDLLNHSDWKYGQKGRIRSFSELFQTWNSEGILTTGTAPVVVQLLFADLIHPQNMGMPYDGDVLDEPKLQPLHRYPRVREIMGKGQEDLILKEVTLASQQNPDGMAWVKELVKNAAEAKANQLDLTLSTDAEGKLVMNLQDNGTGVAKDRSHSFFIPKMSSKKKSAGDIHFGWGLFTLFKYFDEAVIDTSADGKTRHFIHLKKEGDELQIAESDQPGLGMRGTRISARRSAPFAPFDLSNLYGHLLGAVAGMDWLTIRLNGKGINPHWMSPLQKNHFILEAPVSEHYSDGTQAQGKIEVYLSDKPGVYFKGQLFEKNFDRYLGDLPQAVQEALKEVPESFAININAPFRQNLGRTGFTHESDWIDVAKNAATQAATTILLHAVATKPKAFVSQYDFFYDMFHHPDAKAQPLKKDWIQGGTTRHALSSLLREVPLLGGPSLVSLKSEIKAKLMKDQLIDETGKYRTPSPKEVDLSSFKTQYPRLSSVIELFESEIRREINVEENQEKRVREHHQDPSGHLHDLTLEEMATRYPQKREMLRAMALWVEKAAEKLFEEKVTVRFYESADGALAHSPQGQAQIGFNLASEALDQFARLKSLLEKKEHPGEALQIAMELLGVVSHELTHMHEKSGEETHNQKFLDSQKRFVEKLLRLSEKDIFNII